MFVVLLGVACAFAVVVTADAPVDVQLELEHLQLLVGLDHVVDQGVLLEELEHEVVFVHHPLHHGLVEFLILLERDNHIFTVHRFLQSLVLLVCLLRPTLVQVLFVPLLLDQKPLSLLSLVLFRPVGFLL